MNVHRVKRAIIMAAGIGQRMQPLTLETPKPLVRVRGERMIDTVVRALRENGITEIHVVVGYKKEQFEAWAREWPGVDLIENPFYGTCNNISSLYVARAYLGECIILDGKSAYRGNGGDQTRVPVTAGQKVTLNFNAGTGTIE